MRSADQILVFLVAAEAGIHTVVVGGGITVVGAAFHVVLQHRVEPDGGYPQVGEISQPVGDPFQITTVPCIGVVAVHLVFGAHRYLVVSGIAVGKPVGHDQV